MSESGGCLLRIREAFHALTPKERVQANFILKYPELVVNMSIEELAKNCNVSTSSVVRLCKTIGYSGYKEMIRNLFTDISSRSEDNNSFMEITPGDSPDTVARDICQCNIKAIENTLSIMDIAVLSLAVEKISNAHRIDFYGLGSSGLVALDACSKFLRCGKIVYSYTDPHNQLLSALTLKKEDIAVLISYSGETTDILKLAQQIHQQDVPIISLTRYGRNSLSEIADINLFSSSTETLFRIGPMSSRIAQLTVIDILYTAVCSSIFDEVRSNLERSQTACLRFHQNVGIKK